MSCMASLASAKRSHAAARGMPSSIAARFTTGTEDGIGRSRLGSTAPAICTAYCASSSARSCALGHFWPARKEKTRERATISEESHASCAGDAFGVSAS